MYIDKDYTVEMWCSNCKEVVEVRPEAEVIVEDGHSYEVGTYYNCPNDSDHELQEVAICPVCGREMGYYDDFCPACYETGTQWLTEMRDQMGLTQSQLEDLIGNIMGW
jgi:hypothetical protein